MARLPDSKTIKELADLLNETGLGEIEVEASGVRVKVSRQTSAVAASVAAQVSASPAPAAPEKTESIEKKETAPDQHAGAVRSPMVGTAYLCPEPGADNFVAVGKEVKEGQTLLIVEAMKTMNPIIAPHGGTVKDIFIGNEQPVEFGEVLMIIE